VINSYDIDGVINMGEGFRGLRPAPSDIIITGRSEPDEGAYTRAWLHKKAIYNVLFMNPTKFSEKTREGSGHFKAETLNKLLDVGIQIGLHFEDDPVQADIIEQECPRVKVVRICHDLVNKENEWHGPTTPTLHGTSPKTES
jgi:hypothetical protein